MNREEILGMEPGLRLNNAVAELVMGWHQVEQFLFIDKPGNYYVTDPEYRPLILRMIHLLFLPSTDDGDAIKVVRKLNEKDLVVRIKMGDLSIVMPEYRGNTDVFIEAGRLTPEASVRAPSLCLAVCRAALIVATKDAEK